MSAAAPRPRRRALGAVLLAAGCASGPAERSGPPSEVQLTTDVRRIDVPPGAVLDRVCTPSGPERCFDARDDNCNGLVDEGCGLPTGLVQFVIAWQDPSADVDLEVTDPNGELVEVSRPSDSGLVKDRDCPGRSDDCHGQNVENVYLKEDAELLRGAYRVRLRLERMGVDEPPVEVTLGARVGPRSFAVVVPLARPDAAAEILFEL